MKSLLSFYSFNYQGLIDKGFQYSSEALDTAQESNDILSKAMAYTCHGISNCYKGFLEEGEKYLLHGAGFADRINLYSFSAIAYRWLGNAYYEMGKYDESSRYLHCAKEQWEKSGLFPSSENLINVSAIRTDVMREKKLVDLQSLYRNSYTNKVTLYLGTIARCIADILVVLNDKLEEAENWIKKAVRAHEKNGMTWDLGRDYLSYYQILTWMEQPQKAKETLQESKKVFEGCGSDGWAERVRALL